MREVTSTAVRKAIIKAGAHKVSIKQSPIGALCYAHIQFTKDGELIPITDTSVWPAEFYAEHRAIFEAANKYRGCFLTDRDLRLV